MSSNYNSRPRPAEVMVKGREHFLIRERETYKDILRNVRIPKFFKIKLLRHRFCHAGLSKTSLLPGLSGLRNY